MCHANIAYFMTLWFIVLQKMGLVTKSFVKSLLALHVMKDDCNTVALLYWL